MENLVQIENLTFAYPSGVRPLSAVNLTIPKGAIFGLVGKNGAGKTTLFQILLSLLKPQSGSITIAGYKHSDLPRHKLGFVPEHPYYHQNFRLHEYLTYLNKISANPLPAKGVEELIDFVRLTDFKQDYIRTFSKGMQQRVGLAQALLNRPELLILDEPMSGLDVVGQNLMREVILQIHARGTTIILSSHNLYEIERIGTEIGILHKSQLKAVDQEFLQGSQEYALTANLTDAQLGEVAEDLMQKVQGLQLKDGRLHFPANSDEVYFQVMKFLSERQIRIVQLELVKPSLEKFIIDYLSERGEKDA